MNRRYDFGLKSAVSLLALLITASLVQAQGVINFGNNAATPVVMRSWSSGGYKPVPARGGFVQLIFAPYGTDISAPWGLGQPNLTAWLQANPGWMALSDSIRPINLEGRFTASAVTVPVDTPITAIVIGWTGNFTSFDQAYAMYDWGSLQGFSMPFVIDPERVGSMTPPPGIISAGFTGLVMQSMPEPSSAALMLLCACILAARRRLSSAGTKHPE